jgi:hypothetical protein
MMNFNWPLLKNFVRLSCLFCLFIFSGQSNFAQVSVKAADYSGKKLPPAYQRTITVISNQGEPYFQLSEEKSEGIFWLPKQSFESGTIEVVMRGKDVLQKSFLGIAFHGVNDSTYEAIYCRPFNFLTTDSVRKIHAVQYVSHPQYTWKFLRENHNGTYEKGLKNPPNPNDWFTLRMEVKDGLITVFINQDTIPCLVVKQPFTAKGKKIGFFAGSNSGGDFRSIKIWHK